MRNPSGDSPIQRECPDPDRTDLDPPLSRLHRFRPVGVTPTTGLRLWLIAAVALPLKPRVNYFDRGGDIGSSVDDVLVGLNETRPPKFDFVALGVMFG